MDSSEITSDDFDSKPAVLRNDSMTAQAGDTQAEEDKPVEVTLNAQQIKEARDNAINPAPYAFRPFQLADMVGKKDRAKLASIEGGIKAILRGLITDEETGLTKEALSSGYPDALAYYEQNIEPHEGEMKAGLVPSQGSMQNEEVIVIQDYSLDNRRRIFGVNILPKRRSLSLLKLMLAALKDKIMLLLCGAAIVSLVFGLYQDFGVKRQPGEAPVHWVEGAAILGAVLIVVLVGSLNDWQKEKQFKALNEKTEERTIKVIREGKECFIDVKEVVVGDIAKLEMGDVIPFDGIYLSGKGFMCNESATTGESDTIKKERFDESSAQADCFLLSGNKVEEGFCTLVVVAVGPNSFHGSNMMELQEESQPTPLQSKLNRLADVIAKIGLVAGGFMLLVLTAKFMASVFSKSHPHHTVAENILAYVNILIICVTLVVVAVPEGLPLAVTLALAFATKRMTSENLLVRVLNSCETMANASVICTDKTGTLTQNKMTVVAGAIGVHTKFVRHRHDNPGRSNADGHDIPDNERMQEKYIDDVEIDQMELHSHLSPALQELLNEGICINSTVTRSIDAQTNEFELKGNKTESALIHFSSEMNWPDFQQTREAAVVEEEIPFHSRRKFSVVLCKKKNGSGYRAYVKGASEVLSQKCTSHVFCKKPGPLPRVPLPTGPLRPSSSFGTVRTMAIGRWERENINRTIKFYARQRFRTLALCYRDFESLPYNWEHFKDKAEVLLEILFEDGQGKNPANELTLIGIVAIEDPLREGVRDAITQCNRAGVSVKMCTGDNIETAKAIAAQCGIFVESRGDTVMDGSEFRYLSVEELRSRVPKLQVLARASPLDKKVLVETLQDLGKIVGVTGDGTNDAPALKKADVGFSMGITGTEVAKEASDIVVMDDNFTSIKKAIMWGRCVNDAVRKFLQFQLSANLTAILITFFTSAASSDEESVLSAVQLLWINIIMDTFAALALATDPASEKLLEREPDKKEAPLISVDMYKQIFWQSMYQVAVILISHFYGSQIMNLGDSKHSEKVLQTFVFNVFVFAQIFNSVNSRRLDRRLNILEGIGRNWYFVGITFMEIVFQVIIVFFGGQAFKVTPISGSEWLLSVLLGLVSIPLGAFVRLLPNGPHEKVLCWIGLMNRRPQDVDMAVKDDLSTFKSLRSSKMLTASASNIQRSSASASPSRRSPGAESPGLHRRRTFSDRSSQSSFDDRSGAAGGSPTIVVTK